jgi:hypothetical protein
MPKLNKCKFRRLFSESPYYRLRNYIHYGSHKLIKCIKDNEEMYNKTTTELCTEYYSITLICLPKCIGMKQCKHYEEKESEQP